MVSEFGVCRHLSNELWEDDTNSAKEEFQFNVYQWKPPPECIVYMLHLLKNKLMLFLYLDLFYSFLSVLCPSTWAKQLEEGDIYFIWKSPEFYFMASFTFQAYNEASRYMGRVSSPPWRQEEEEKRNLEPGVICNVIIPLWPASMK